METSTVILPRSDECLIYEKYIELTGNSTNCKTGIDGNVFIKVQLYEATDNICYDILNNFIIDQLLETSKIQNTCFTSLIGCSITQVKYMLDSRRIFLGVKKDGKPNVNNKPIVNTTSDLPIVYCAKLMKQTYVRGPLLKNMKYSSEHHTAILQLFNQLQTFGLRFGFAHRDAHLANIIFNTQTSQFVIIDYGRAIFKTTVVKEIFDKFLAIADMSSPSPFTQHYINILSIINHDTYNMYKAYSDDDTLPRYQRLSNQFTDLYKQGDKLTYLYDISTICLNLLFNNIAKTQGTQYNVFNGDSSLNGVKNSDNEWTTFNITFPNPNQNLLISDYLKTLKPTLSPHIAILLDGFGFFVDFVIDYDLQQETENSNYIKIIKKTFKKTFNTHVTYTIDFNRVKEMNLMYEYFQYLQPGSTEFTKQEDYFNNSLQTQMIGVKSKQASIPRNTTKPQSVETLQPLIVNSYKPVQRPVSNPANENVKPPINQPRWNIVTGKTGGSSTAFKMSGPMKKHTLLNTNQERIFTNILREQYIKAAMTNETPCFVNLK